MGKLDDQASNIATEIWELGVDGKAGISKQEEALHRLVLQGQLEILNHCYTHKWMGSEPTGTDDLMKSIALNVQDSIRAIEAELQPPEHIA